MSAIRGVEPVRSVLLGQRQGDSLVRGCEFHRIRKDIPDEPRHAIRFTDQLTQGKKVVSRAILFALMEGFTTGASIGAVHP